MMESLIYLINNNRNFVLGNSLVDSFVEGTNSNCKMSKCNKINR